MVPFAEPATRRRFAAGSRGADGRYVLGASTDTTIRAGIQPVSGRKLERLPEGLRQTVTHLAFTETELRTADQITGLPADQVVYGGETFEVERVDPWPSAGPLPHYEAYLRRAAETGGAP